MKHLKKIALLLVIALACVVLVLYMTSWKQPNTEPTPAVFPNIDGAVGNEGDILTIETTAGNQIPVRNFLADPDTVKDNSNEGIFYLGNHFPKEAQEQPITPEYVIEYIEQTDYFNIGLYREPISEARHHAEQYLKEDLGITEEQMCQLNYNVSVPYWVNEFYAGMSLGFSFCPGSRQLE